MTLPYSGYARKRSFTAITDSSLPPLSQLVIAISPKRAILIL